MQCVIYTDQSTEADEQTKQKQIGLDRLRRAKTSANKSIIVVSTNTLA